MAVGEREIVQADPTLAERFWRKVEKRGPDDCWNWTGGTRNRRYGNIKAGGKRGPMIAAHRIQMIWCGADTDGRIVMHTCDNGLCVNPAHLVVGTQAENMADMAAKGRKVAPSGEQNGKAVLTNEQVAQIRRDLAAGAEPAAIARALDVDYQTIWRLAAGHSYRAVASEIQHPRPAPRKRKEKPAKKVGPRLNLKRRILTDEQAAEILARAMAGDAPASEIGARFGISGALVYAIKHRRAYAWVTAKEPDT